MSSSRNKHVRMLRGMRSCCVIGMRSSQSPLEGMDYVVHGSAIEWVQCLGPTGFPLLGRT
jgi:hypothetical protein